MKLAHCKNEEGQALVELAIALPILLVILCGVLDFGWIFVNNYSVNQASYAGARCASLNVESLSSTQLEEIVNERVEENLALGSSDAQVTLTVGTDEVSVTVERPIKTLTFVAYALFGPTYTSSSTSVAVY